MPEKYLYIDDEPAIAAAPFAIRNYDSLYSLANAIKGNKEKEIILINIHFYFSPSNAPEKYYYLQNSAGIDLLKMLRLLGENRHCVLYSPMSVKQLLQLNPGNLIMTSHGVTYINSSDKLRSLEWNKLVEQKALLSFPKEYFKVDYQMPEDNRHNWANWWGIMQLADTYKNVFVEDQLRFINADNLEIPYPSKVYERFKELKCQQAIYLFGHSPKDFIKASNELVLSDFEKLIRILDNQISFIEKRLTLSGKQNPKHDHWVDLKKYYGDNIRNVPDANAHEFIHLVKQLEDIINQKRIELMELNAKKVKALSSLNELKKGKPFRTIESLQSEHLILKISDLRESVLKKNPKILYIDDQAKDGWDEIFKMLIYNNLEAPFEIIHETGKSVDKLYTDIQNKISSFKPDLVLLDLRLNDETGNVHNIDALSGALILKKIRIDFPGLPIMMTTASNKVWSYQTLLQNGADCYWIKEGIDNYYKPEDSINNLHRFFYFISTLCSRKYHQMIKIGNLIRTYKFQNAWWVHYNREIGKGEIEIDNSISEIYNLLKEILVNIRIYLQFSNISNLYSEDETITQSMESLYTSGIINKLATILEIISDVKERDLTSRSHYKKITGFSWGNDGIVNSILERRNDASHRYYRFHSSWKNLEDQIIDVIDVLKTKPFRHVR